MKLPMFPTDTMSTDEREKHLRHLQVSGTARTLLHFHLEPGAVREVRETKGGSISIPRQSALVEEYLFSALDMVGVPVLPQTSGIYVSIIDGDALMRLHELLRGKDVVYKRPGLVPIQEPCSCDGCRYNKEHANDKHPLDIARGWQETEAALAQPSSPPPEPEEDVPPVKEKSDKKKGKLKVREGRWVLLGPIDSQDALVLHVTNVYFDHFYSRSIMKAGVAYPLEDVVSCRESFQAILLDYKDHMAAYFRQSTSTIQPDYRVGQWVVGRHNKKYGQVVAYSPATASVRFRSSMGEVSDWTATTCLHPFPTEDVAKTYVE